ncbi:VOC family protein [Curtanaerobium respiraculi]|nr:VOC family protein [Curtanaerobium respiraculi]
MEHAYTTFMVENLDATVDFYQTALGMDLARQFTAPAGRLATSCTVA